MIKNYNNKFAVLFGAAFLFAVLTLCHSLPKPDYGLYEESVYASSDMVYDDGLYSQSVIMLDITGQRVFFSKNGEEKRPVASLTKLMTTVVALENLNSLELEFTLTADIIEKAEALNASMAGFCAGERVSAVDLLHGTALPSGGEAAMALARLCTGSEESFVALMNEKAKELGMKNTLFTDVTGLDDQNSYSTALDMAKLFEYALDVPRFLEIISCESYLTKATPQHPDGILLKSTLSEPLSDYDLRDKIIGGKTGYTVKAGLCLASYSKTEKGEYILVSLGAGKGENYPLYHFADAKKLYELTA